MEYDFKNKTLIELFENTFLKEKDKTFCIYQRADESREYYSYNDILTESNYILAKMQKSGLKKGDRVGIIAALRPWWFALYYACLRGGYILVCMDPGIPAAQLQKMMVDTEIRSCFTTLKRLHLPDELNEHIPVYSIESGFPLLSKCDKPDYLLGDCTKYPEDTCFVLFSSGTTGENRKAVLHTEKSVTLPIEYATANDAGVYKKTCPFVHNDRDLLLFPPYHIAGFLCIMNDIIFSTTIIILERLTPSGLNAAMQELKPDLLSTVPSMLSSLYKKIVSSYSKKAPMKFAVNNLLAFSGLLRRKFGIKAGRVFLSQINKQAFGGNMKRFIVGASPFEETANKFFLDMGIDISMNYGLTEIGAPLTTTGEGYYPGSAGRVLKNSKGFDLRIVNKDENGRGEIEIKSPYRMITYLNEKDNEGCFTEDGYFKTGDLGHFNKDKCLVISGRAKETIVLKNGEKLLPEEIESKYQNLDCVKEVAAFKIPGPGGCDEFAIAMIKDKTKAIPDEAMKVRVYERADRLPSIYRPSEVFVVKEFPLSSSHKIQRFRLTQMAINGQDNPITDATMIPIDEDATTSALRKILVEVGGPQWKTQELTQGLLLNLDSLSLVNLYVAIEEKWNIDLFQTSIQPDTFGELLDIVKNYNELDKNDKQELDLSKYPLPVSPALKFAIDRLKFIVKTMWHVKAFGLDNLPDDTNYLICPIHRSDIDPALLSSVIPKNVMDKTCIVGKAELVQDKLFKKITTSANIIPVDRTGNSIQTLDRCKELLLEGWNIIIFPEGTSVQNHTKVFPLKEGASRLSISTDKPIIPVYIDGIEHNDKEMNDFALPSLKSRIKIYFGKPIYHNDMNASELTQLLAEKIQELQPQDK